MRELKLRVACGVGLILLVCLLFLLRPLAPTFVLHRDTPPRMLSATPSPEVRRGASTDVRSGRVTNDGTPSPPSTLSSLSSASSLDERLKDIETKLNQLLLEAARHGRVGLTPEDIAMSIETGLALDSSSVAAFLLALDCEGLHRFQRDLMNLVHHDPPLQENEGPPYADPLAEWDLHRQFADWQRSAPPVPSPFGEVDFVAPSHRVGGNSTAKTQAESKGLDNALEKLLSQFVQYRDAIRRDHAFDDAVQAAKQHVHAPVPVIESRRRQRQTSRRIRRSHSIADGGGSHLDAVGDEQESTRPTEASTIPSDDIKVASLDDVNPTATPFERPLNEATVTPDPLHSTLARSNTTESLEGAGVGDWRKELHDDEDTDDEEALKSVVSAQFVVSPSSSSSPASPSPPITTASILSTATVLQKSGGRKRNVEDEEEDLAVAVGKGLVFDPYSKQPTPPSPSSLKLFRGAGGGAAGQLAASMTKLVDLASPSNSQSVGGVQLPQFTGFLNQASKTLNLNPLPQNPLLTPPQASQSPISLVPQSSVLSPNTFVKPATDTFVPQGAKALPSTPGRKSLALSSSLLPQPSNTVSFPRLPHLLPPPNSNGVMGHREGIQHLLGALGHRLDSSVDDGVGSWRREYQEAMNDHFPRHRASLSIQDLGSHTGHDDLSQWRSSRWSVGHRGDERDEDRQSPQRGGSRRWPEDDARRPSSLASQQYLGDRLHDDDDDQLHTVRDDTPNPRLSEYEFLRLELPDAPTDTSALREGRDAVHPSEPLIPLPDFVPFKDTKVVPADAPAVSSRGDRKDGGEDFDDMRRRVAVDEHPYPPPAPPLPSVVPASPRRAPLFPALSARSSGGGLGLPWDSLRPAAADRGALGGLDGGRDEAGTHGLGQGRQIPAPSTLSSAASSHLRATSCFSPPCTANRPREGRPRAPSISRFVEDREYKFEFE